MNDLKILSGGAAQGLVERLAPEFKALTGAGISGEFGAVGAMSVKLRDGMAADVVILTQALVTELTEMGLVARKPVSDIGKVETAVAIRSADPWIAIDNADHLRGALLAADEIYVPDTKVSTAGIHVASVLVKLEIMEQVGPRLRIYPNGATAMRHLAASTAQRAIGCTQATEILNTPGIVLVGSLPPGCGLSTTYTAAVTMRTANSRAAGQLIDLLTSPQHGALRASVGFS